MCTNLAIERGPHIVRFAEKWFPWTDRTKVVPINSSMSPGSPRDFLLSDRAGKNPQLRRTKVQPACRNHFSRPSSGQMGSLTLFEKGQALHGVHGEYWRMGAGFSIKKRFLCFFRHFMGCVTQEYDIWMSLKLRVRPKVTIFVLHWFTVVGKLMIFTLISQRLR